MIAELISLIRSNEYTNEVLDISHQKLTYSQFSELFLALQMNTHIRRLNLSNTHLNATVYPLLSLLSKNTLSALDLSNNELTPAAATPIAEILQTSPDLRILNLTGNKLGPIGAYLVTAALVGNTTLHSLHLSHNQLGNVGANLVGMNLAQKNALRYLNLNGNKIGFRFSVPFLCYNDLFTAFSMDEDLRRRILALQVSCVNFQHYSVFGFQLMLSHNDSLKTLSLWDNMLTDTEISGLSNDLAQNRGLESIILGSNPINNSTALTLLQILEVNRNIFCINLNITFIQSHLIHQINTKTEHNREAYAKEFSATFASLSAHYNINFAPFLLTHVFEYLFESHSSLKALTFSYHKPKTMVKLPLLDDPNKMPRCSL